MNHATVALAQAFPCDPEHPPAARPAGRRGAPGGILDVAYHMIDSPVGPLLLAATEEGLIRVAYAREGHDAVLQTLADKVSPRILSAPGRLDTAARELDEYFAGRGTRSTCRWTGGCLPGSAARCWATCPRSATGTPPATPPSPSWRGTRKRSARSAPPARPTRCRWWCRVTAWSAPTAAWAATSAAPTPSAPCSLWRRPRRPRTGRGGGRAHRLGGGPRQPGRPRLRPDRAAAHRRGGGCDRRPLSRRHPVPVHGQHGPAPLRRRGVPATSPAVPRGRHRAEAGPLPEAAADRPRLVDPAQPPGPVAGPPR